MSTTKVRFLTCVSSHDFGCVSTGDVAEIDSDEAGRMIAAGFAEPVDGKKSTATRNPVKRKAVQE